MTRGYWALVVAILIPAHEAAASVFGEENVTLGAILAEQIRENAQFAQQLLTIKQVLTTARDGVNLARDAVQVVQNVRMIVDDPEGYLKANAMQFLRAFPEAEGLMRDTIAIRKEIGALKKGEYTRYDPYAFEQVFIDLHKLNNDMYSSIARVVDTWGISDSQDELMQSLRTSHRKSAELIATMTADQALNLLTPQRAAVYNAQAAAIDAQASVEAAAMYQEMLRIAKLRLMGDVESRNTGVVQLFDAMQMPESIDSWTLYTGSPEQN